MKITVDVDCTPEEVRRVFGLPDMTPVNDALMNTITARIEKGIGTDDVEKIVRLWMGGASAGLGELQKGLWSILKTTGGKTEKSDDD